MSYRQAVYWLFYKSMLCNDWYVYKEEYTYVAYVLLSHVMIQWEIEKCIGE